MVNKNIVTFVVLAVMPNFVGAAAPIATRILVTPTDAHIWGGNSDGTKSAMATRAKKIDVMKGLYYSTDDKELLADHTAVAELVEWLAGYFKSWYTQGSYIVIEKPEYHEEYMYLLEIAQERIAIVLASLNKLATKKTSNKDFQNIRVDILDQVQGTDKAVDRLKNAIKTYVG